MASSKSKKKTTKSSKRRRPHEEYKRCKPYWCENCHRLVTLKPCRMCEHDFITRIRERRFRLKQRLKDPFDKQINDLAFELFGNNSNEKDGISEISEKAS